MSGLFIDWLEMSLKSLLNRDTIIFGLSCKICYNTDKKGEFMVAVKQKAQEMIKNLPENCTYEDIQYHLYVIEKIKKGTLRAEKGEVSSQQEAKKRMAKWLSH